MLRQDLIYAVRSLLRRPGFSLVAVTTLALGIGANTAIFSVVNAVLLRPLPFDQPERLVRLHGGARGTAEPGNLSPMDFLDLRDRARLLDSMAAYNNYADATLTGEGEPELLAGTRVTDAFFKVLGISPVAGRDFARDDDRPDAARVAILSHGFWQRRFAGDPSVVGRTIHLNSIPTVVIGVLPASFQHPLPDDARQPDVYVPFRLDPKENNRGGHYLQAIGRLQRADSLASAQLELSAIAADLERTYPRTNTGQIVLIVPLFDSMVGSARTPLLILLATVGLVLLIACANLANLMVARSTTRRRELAIRQAIGATRMDLVRQVMIESLVLALAGGAAALGVASVAVRMLALIGADRVPRADGTALDPFVLLFTLGLCVATAFAFGLGPALASARLGTADTLKDGERGGSAGAMHLRAQQALVAGELALTLMLLVGAGLLVKSFLRLSSVDPGFRPDRVLSLRTSLPLARYAEGDEIPFYRTLEERLRGLPGVTRVGAVNILPLSPNYSCDGFQIEGRPPLPPGQEPCAEARSITPEYFAAMGVPVLRGRAFRRDDTESSLPVIMVSNEMADRYWPDGNPVGSRIRYQGTTREIVGVAGGIRHFGLDRQAPMAMYTPHAQQPSYHTMTIVIRGEVEPSSLVTLVRHELSALDRDVPVSAVATMNEMLSRSTSVPRFRTVLIGAFAALAVVLSVVGVGGVVGYGVARRTREIGVRVALGATSGQVMKLILRQGMAPAAIGVALGLVGALAAARALSSLLFGVTPADPIVLASATGVLVFAALAATCVPARRAMSVDPMLALRAE